MTVRDVPSRTSAGEMVWIPGGSFRMGSDDHYPEERPAHQASVEGFRMDRTAVTNAAFAAFVDETRYMTVAERPPAPSRYPTVPEDLLVPGSAVFCRPSGPVDLRDPLSWWRYVPGADWRHPEGPGSDASTRMNHPVVHVALEDAQAFATWSAKDLPTEAEWEHAAWGGLRTVEYSWGDDFAPGDRLMANVWVGEFPTAYERRGEPRTEAVGSYPPNAWGLYDMIGNVWEWTTDRWSPRHEAASRCCETPFRHAAASPDYAATDGSPLRVAKGGSYLCASNYCARYRPAARIAQAIDSSAGNLGFRCAKRG